MATCLYSVRPGGARAAKYALAAAVGAVDARFTARGPAPPTMVCAVATAGMNLQSASATTVLKLVMVHFISFYIKLPLSHWGHPETVEK